MSLIQCQVCDRASDLKRCNFMTIAGLCLFKLDCPHQRTKVLLKARGFGKSLLRGVEGAAPYNEEDIDNG